MRLMAIFAVIPGIALAGPLTITGAAPIQNTDGTLIPASGAGSLTGMRVEYGTCSGTAFGTKQGEFTIAMPATSGPSPNLAPGTYCFRAAWKNTFGSESAMSNPVQGTVAAPVPNPGSITVTVPVAFKMRQTIDGFSFVSIGSVPIGTPCDATHSVDGKYLVPRAKVTLTSRFDTMPLIVFAECS